MKRAALWAARCFLYSLRSALASIWRKNSRVSFRRTWISGYKPRANFQNALINGIERYLVATQDTVVAEDDAVQALDAGGGDIVLYAFLQLSGPAGKLKK
jgi:hypothetical protein